MFFDSHAHYDDERFDIDRFELIERLHSGGVDFIVDPAQDKMTTEKCMALAEKYPFFYFAAGYHPHESGEMGDGELACIEKALEHKKCVAVGEIGLDYHYDFHPRDVQRRVFRQMLELCRKTGKPAIVHNRESTEDCMEILREFPDVRGVVHCYSGSWETAKELLDMGWYISFTGSVTFKNARKVLETAENMPLERMMIETDCPYMTPEPHRGERNDSSMLKFIAEKIGGLRGKTAEEIAAITSENAHRFFGI